MFFWKVIRTSKLTKGLAIAGIPVYVVGGFLIGQYLGRKAGNEAAGVILGLFAGLLLSIYDIYQIVASNMEKDDHG